MYTRMMVPVDLAHLDQLDKSLKAAADLALHYKIPIIYVSVVPTAPTEIAHNPTEFAEKLKAFAEDQAQANDLDAEAIVCTSPDPSTDVDDTLLATLVEIDADLVVMASHVPTIADYIWPSNGGKIASHARASVFLVR